MVREEIAEEYDEESGKTVSGYITYSTVQLTPDNIAAIKAVPGVTHCSARQENLTPFEELSLFPGTVPTDPEYKGHTKVLGVWDTQDDELLPGRISGRRSSGCLPPILWSRLGKPSRPMTKSKTVFS